MSSDTAGEVVLRGHRVEDLQKFILRFCSKGRRQALVDAGLDNNYNCFHGSSMYRQEKGAYYSLFESIEEVDDDDDIGSFRLRFYAKFTHSANECLIARFHTGDSKKESHQKDGFLSVMDAADSHEVWFEVYTEELNQRFQEHILVNSQGKIQINERIDILIENDDGTTEISSGFIAEDGFCHFVI